MRPLVLVFSKDRPMQLDACLRSLQAQCVDAPSVDVLFAASRMFALPARSFGRSLTNYIPDHHFETQVRNRLASHEFVLFVTDDTVFVRPFSLAEMVAALRYDPAALGVSLRLGSNTVWSYPPNAEQKVPALEPAGGFLRFDWRTAAGDFAYPLELSSSFYRTSDVAAYLDGRSFRNPNELEDAMASNVDRSAEHALPYLLCAPFSLAFSVPCNRVQQQYQNRCGTDRAYSADALLELWEQGYRIDVAALAGHTPRACHEEVRFVFSRKGDL